MADYRLAVPFILKAEGGLSRNPNDTASRWSSPCSKNGVSGWHTNKGVTWRTFNSLGDKLGYDGSSCDLFMEMPDWVWGKIFKQGYWDKIYGDTYKNQAVANMLVDFAYGSGVTGSRRQMSKFLEQEFNKPTESWSQIRDVVNTIPASFLLPKLEKFRLEFFQSLNQDTFIKGWTNRLNSLSSYNSKWVTSVKDEVGRIKKETPILFYGAFGLLAIGIGIILVAKGRGK